jgi:hypothetical protein
VSPSRVKTYFHRLRDGDGGDTAALAMMSSFPTRLVVDRHRFQLWGGHGGTPDRANRAGRRGLCVIGYANGRRHNLPPAEFGHAGYEAKEGRCYCGTPAQFVADTVESLADLALTLGDTRMHRSPLRAADRARGRTGSC